MVLINVANCLGRRGKRDLLQPDQLIINRTKPFEAIWATNYCTFLRESQTEIIWAVGLNNYKQLAHAKETDRVLIPIKTDLKDVKQIAGGQHHTLVLDNKLNCYAVGRPDYGRLGIGDVKEVVEKLTPIKALSGKTIYVGCGEACSYAITKDGKLYTWGMGSNNQLGVGDGDDELEPALVTSKNTENKRMLLANGGGQHSVFLVESDVQKKATAPPTKKVKAVPTEPAPAKENADDDKKAKEKEPQDEPPKSAKATAPPSKKIKAVPAESAPAKENADDDKKAKEKEAQDEPPKSAKGAKGRGRKN